MSSSRTSKEKVTEHRKRLRAAGLRPIKFGFPTCGHPSSPRKRIGSHWLPRTVRPQRKIRISSIQLAKAR